MKILLFTAVLETVLLLLSGCTTQATACPNHQFRCGDGSYCVPNSWKCDGAKDCPDGTDERGCGQSTCRSSLFTCNNGKCILPSWKCDRQDDCGDYSDERNEICADKPKCQFTCDNGKCLDSVWVCDTYDDCGDNSDETRCGGAAATSHPTTIFSTTPTTTPTTTPATTLAITSPKSLCTSDELECYEERKCLPKLWTCDGFFDCGDKSDEQGCGNDQDTNAPATLSPTTIRDYISSTVPTTTSTSRQRPVTRPVRGLSETVDVCGETKFLCNSGSCTYSTWRCDGDDDCGDNSDELNCEDEGSSRSARPTVFVRRGCGEKHFECSSSKECIHERWVCDQERDCRDGSDEVECVGDPSIILAAKSTIKKISEDLQTVEDLYTKLTGVVALDVDIQTQIIYWSDVRRKQIRRGSLNGLYPQVVIASGLGVVEGIAVDWVGQNLYWTDSLSSSISVSGLQGEHRKTFVGMNLDKPRAIAVHPSGYMFWTEWRNHPRLSRCSMDGNLETQRTLIDKEIIWPNALTIDYSSNTLWWADAKLKKIESCDLDGTNRKIFLQNVGYPFSIAVSSTHIYWSNWETKTLEKVGKYSMYKYTEKTSSFSSYPLAITFIDAKKHEAVASECLINNGGCSHLCLLSSDENRFTCQCPDNLQISHDLKRCQPRVAASCSRKQFLCDKNKCLNAAQKCDGKQDCVDNTDEQYCLTDKPWLVFGNRKSYIGLCDLTQEKGIKRIEEVESVTGLDIDVKNSYVFWADTVKNAIMKSAVNHNGDLISTTVITDKYVFTPESVAFEWITNKLYWIDSQSRKIEVIDVDTKHRCSIVTTGLRKPRSLALHPKIGYLFWTDWGARPYLATIALDGNPDSRRKVVETGLKWPNAVTIDYANDVIYWADAYYDRIERMSVGGGKRNYFLTTLLKHPFGLTIYKDFVYWSDWQFQAIYRADKYEGLGDIKVRQRIFQPMELTIFDRSRQSPVILNPCAVYNGACSHICLLSPSYKKYTCRCPMHTTISKDGKTCVSLYGITRPRKTNSLFDINVL